MRWTKIFGKLILPIIVSEYVIFATVICAWLVINVGCKDEAEDKVWTIEDGTVVIYDEGIAVTPDMLKEPEPNDTIILAGKKDPFDVCDYFIELTTEPNELIATKVYEGQLFKYKDKVYIFVNGEFILITDESIPALSKPEPNEPTNYIDANSYEDSGNYLEDEQNEPQITDNQQEISKWQEAYPFISLAPNELIESCKHRNRIYCSVGGCDCWTCMDCGKTSPETTFFPIAKPDWECLGCGKRIPIHESHFCLRQYIPTWPDYIELDKDLVLRYDFPEPPEPNDPLVIHAPSEFIIISRGTKIYFKEN